MEQFATAVVGLVMLCIALAVLAFLIDTPWRRERDRQRRIRQDAFIRGQAYWQGKYSVTHQPAATAPAPSDPWAPIVPAQVHEAAGFKRLLVVLVVAIGFAIAWMSYDVGRHAAPSAAGVTVAAQPGKRMARKQHKAAKATPVQKMADVVCLSTSQVPASDGKCYAQGEAMPLGVTPISDTYTTQAR